MYKLHRRRTSMILSAVLAVAWMGSTAVTWSQDLPRYTETITSETGEKLSFEMVRLPGGTFEMGSPESESGRNEDEGPRHPVQVDPFFLCTTEATLDLFLAYYQETVTARKDFFELEAAAAAPLSDDVDAVTGPTPVYGDLTMGYSKQHPAIGMTWYNAMNFCKWLRKKTGKPYRLPTEAEWEYACRAGTTGAYFFGDDPAPLGDYAWFEDNSNLEPHAVAAKKPNPWGLHDMTGNVWEWVYDYYSPTAYQGTGSEPVANPTGPKEGKVNVARGGAHDSPADRLRSAARGYREPWWDQNDPQIPKSRWWLPQMNFIGFRVACSIASDTAQAEKPKYAFVPDGQGNFTFDTGVLRGVLHGADRRGGLSSVVHVPSEKRLDGGAGILGFYRVFTANHRYGATAWDWPGQAVALDDGAVRVTWPEAEDRPFLLQAVYRWADAASLDVEVTVEARHDLKAFEVFVASYFAEGFDWPYVWVAGRPGQPQGGFVLADKSMGEWLMFTNPQTAPAIVRDGRWTYAPNPVDWALAGRLQAPLAFRRDAAGGLLPAVMAPQGDCFAVATPYRGEAHRSLYLSLFGRDIKAGQRDQARARFAALPTGSSRQIFAYYERYIENLGGPAKP